MTDVNGNSASANAVVTVNDATAPTALASNLTVALNASGSAAITASQIDAGSFDNCGIATISVSPSSFTCANVGPNTVTLTVTDVNGNSASANAVVTVIDNSAPTFVYSPMITLWPPNHQYETVTLAQAIAAITDNCSTLPIGSAVITSAWSDEPENANGNGDGNTVNDIVINPGCQSVKLRAERAGGGNGRVYTINVRVTDANNNTTNGSFKVGVQHNVGSPAVDNGAAAGYTVSGPCGAPKSMAATTLVPAGYALDQNHPNPFNPSTTVQYSVADEVHVRLAVYNAFGAQVATLVDGVVPAGTHRALFDAGGLTSGTYVVMLEANGVVLTRTMSLVK